MLVTPTIDPVAKIKVVGVGGGGGNAINTMISDFNIEGVEFIVMNTDAQVLKNSLAPLTLQLGQKVSGGLGVGGNHNLGAEAAEESIDQITEYLSGADMVFVTAGMGGGTGTGAAPIVAGVAKNLGALTIAVVTKPFNFEGKRRMDTANEGIAELKSKVDALIVVPNQGLLDLSDDDLTFLEAMKEGDKVLAQGIDSIAGMVSRTGFINVDFADVKSVMQNAGSALMGIGRATGENRAENAARDATNSPLLDMSIEGATGILFNIAGGLNMSLKEVNYAAEMIHEAVDANAKIIFGARIDPDLGDELAITIIATGFDETKQVYTSKKKDEAVRPSLVQSGRDASRVVDTPSDYVDTANEPYSVAPEPVRPVATIQQHQPYSAAPVSPISPRPAPQPLRPQPSDNRTQGGGDDLEVPAFMRRK